MGMIVAKSLEDLKKKLKVEYERIVEDEELFWIKTKDGWITVFKPRKREEVESILREGRFPARYVRQVLAKERLKTEALRKAMRAKKRWILQSGMAGVGKTYALTFKLSVLARYYRISSPLYVPLQSFSIPEYRDLYPQADSYLLDDLNTNLGSHERDFVIELIYHAYNENKILYMTTNSKVKPEEKDEPSVLTFLKEEPVISRLFEMCEFQVIKERKDLRLENRR